MLSIKEAAMTDTRKQNPPSGGTPALDHDRNTVAIPRPANELDGQSALRGRVDEEPDDDPQKAG
jgi:hypothetical protein